MWSKYSILDANNEKSYFGGEFWLLSWFYWCLWVESYYFYDLYICFKSALRKFDKMVGRTFKMMCFYLERF